jgi:predicted dehydrogenase
MGWWGRTLVEAVADSEQIRVVAGATRTVSPEVKAFAETQKLTLVDSYEALLADKHVDAVVLATPHSLHAAQTIAAAKAGKHVFCEKPIALDYAQAKEMYEAAEKAGIVHFLNHNYRRVPAVRLAKRLIDEGRVGRVFHWRGAYLQDWIVDPNFPLTWHLRKETAGMGPQIDLGSHNVDLARYLVGEIKSVTGMATNFVTERPLPSATAATFKGGASGEGTGKVTVEDAAFTVVEFANGALGSFEVSRFAPGRKNYNYFEIYGEKGSILFDFEKMNELQFYSAEDPDYARGFKTILCTEGSHDFISNWWPPGHVIGYEHAFVHGVVDFVDAIVHKKKVEPNFYDGMRTAQVLDAGMRSAATGARIAL